MIVTVGDALPRQAQGHIGDSCVKRKNFLSDVSDVVDQTGTVWGCIERVEMTLKPVFHMIVTVIVSICDRLIGDTSPMCRSRSPTVKIIWTPGFIWNKISSLNDSVVFITTTGQRKGNKFELSSNMAKIKRNKF